MLSVVRWSGRELGNSLLAQRRLVSFTAEETGDEAMVVARAAFGPPLSFPAIAMQLSITQENSLDWGIGFRGHRAEDELGATSRGAGTKIGGRRL